MKISPPKGIAVAIAAVLLVQSCTATMPINGRVIDARSREPVPGARVHATWRTTIATLAGSLPGTVIRQRSAITDLAGRYRIWPGIALHAPVFPFSTHLRIGLYLPTIDVSAEGYETRGVVNEFWSPLGFVTPHGILSLRWSSWNGRDIELARANVPPSLD
jgi:hypothetical protein